MTAGAHAAAFDGPGSCDDIASDITSSIARVCARRGADALAAIEAWQDECEGHSVIGKRIRGEHWITLYDGEGRKVASGYAQTKAHAEILCARDLWLSRRGM